MEIVSQSPAQTKTIAAEMLKQFSAGDIVGLQGELGSGKTTFIQGLAQALGITQPVTSPTFISLQIYPVKNHPNISQLCHVDAYRFKNKDDAISAGITDYLGRSDTLCLVEWPENISGLIPSDAKIIHFFHRNETSRIINCEKPEVL